MDASTLPKGQSSEKTDGRLRNEPGTYKHKPTGAILITPEGEEGVLYADSVLDTQKWGTDWERIGDVPSRVELLKMRKAQESSESKSALIEIAKKPAPGTGETFEPKK